MLESDMNIELQNLVQSELLLFTLDANAENGFIMKATI